MQSCEQAPGMNILDHGITVHEEYLKLMEERDLPDHLLGLWDHLHLMPNYETMRLYHWYHDCGKPLCLTIDENGKRHFPNHAETSYRLFLKHCRHCYKAAELIRLDMGFHTLRGEELDKLIEHPLALPLYFTAWAEIRANAQLFGGLESESYKIKAKRLLKAGKKLLAELERFTSEPGRVTMYLHT